MLSDYIRKPEVLNRVYSCVGGSRLAEYAESLEAARYSAKLIRVHVWAIAHFVSWAATLKLPLKRLTDAALDGFEAHLKTCGCEEFRQRSRVPARVRSFIGYLRQQGMVPPRELSMPQGPALLGDFRRWLLETRGVREATLRGYLPVIRELIETLGAQPSTYKVEQLREFIRSYLSCRRIKNASHIVTPVRMFLRFLSSHQRCSAGLVDALPTAAQWRHAGIPQYLPADDIERVLQSTARARHPLRDRAIGLLLHRFALRAGDIVGLKLEDIDWRRGIIRICGKERREALMPLTQETGQALAEYIKQERPRVAQEHVFLVGETPFRPLGKTTVPSIVRLAILRAGVQAPSHGAHILRRSAATQMLRKGASLTDIATTLRHRSVDTTVLYAKVDTQTLMLVAQPWPEVPPC